ncbi:unnamed protein product [Caenorhabditis auriculariae]|uniref:Thyrotropin-releasing hormone receptor n=1 Tax=Caenorhabditis auriculariae TaxID=2777116 RepID=A0A8S1GNT4_9PELO|nr:unnamed protein product [Caenorhabditis auriculariae]
MEHSRVLEICPGSIRTFENNVEPSRKVVKMLALVVVIFAVCWLPYRGMVVYNSFVTDQRLLWNPEWYINFSKTLIFVNCAINPILYNLMSERFRSAFCSLFSQKPTHNQNLLVSRVRQNTAQSVVVRTTSIGHPSPGQRRASSLLCEPRASALLCEPRTSALLSEPPDAQPV